MTEEYIKCKLRCANNAGRKQALINAFLAIIWISSAGTSLAAPSTYTDRASFLAAASDISLTLESFEALPNSAPSPFHIGGITLQDSQGTITANTPSIFPLTITDGVRSWGLGGAFRPTGTNDFPATITFDHPVNAVGFDIGDALTSATLLTLNRQ